MLTLYSIIFSYESKNLHFLQYFDIVTVTNKQFEAHFNPEIKFLKFALLYPANI
jgi:hypothetical protein